MTTFTTIGQYAVLVGLAGAAYFISQRRGDKAPRTKVTTKQVKAAVEKQKPAKTKKARKEGGHSTGDQGSNEKESKKTEETHAAPAPATQRDSDESDGISNEEFAAQYTSAKSGTYLPSKTSEGGRQKSVKQSKAQQKAASFEASSDATGPSSAAGGDADDDRSSANSPEFGATPVDAPISNGGFNDMLEAPAAGPSVLKITSPINPPQPKKASTQSTAEPAATKKQRQNRKKVEEKQAIREEEEKQRKVALEKQRRTAREAEGRAAKDGSTFMASQASSSSAWTASKEPVNGNESATQANNELDTYDPESSKATASSNSESELVGGDWQKIASTLPEEEQVRRAVEESDNWETVKEKRGKKKTTTTQSPQEKSETENSTEPPRQRTPTTVKPATGNGSGTEPKAKSHVVVPKAELQDSEWDVAGYGDN